MRDVTFAVLAVGLAGCASVDAPDATPREGAAQVDAWKAAAPSRGQMIRAERVARVVQWPAVDAVDAQLVAGLEPELAQAVAAAPLPVLLPSALPLQRAKLMHGTDWWALWAQHDGITLTLNASGSARVYPHLRGARNPHTVRGVEGLVTQNESVWSAAWVEHGVAYMLGIECADPTMPACSDDARVRELTESLVFVGGRR